MNMHALSMSDGKPGAPFAESAGEQDPTVRVIFLVRLILALAGLLILEQARFLSQVQSKAGRIVCLLYVLYSLLLYGAACLRDLRSWRWHWLDLAWGIAALAASGGEDSVFHLFFLFPVFVAVTLRGGREGMTVLVVSVFAALATGIAMARPALPAWPLMLSRALLLAMVGYVIVHWTSMGILQKRRLELLQDLNRVPNPRFGPTRLIESALERLRDFYRADTCLAVLSSEGGKCLHVAEKGHAGTTLHGGEAAELAARLQSLPDAWGVWVHGLRVSGRQPRVHVDGARGLAREGIRAAAIDLSGYLDAGGWVSAPLMLRGEPAGRLYVLSRDGRFDAEDIRILRQAGEQLMPLLETVQLLDGMATRAASKERDRLSLDMHDMTIQPYLGLKLGLEVLRRKAAPDNPLLADLDELHGMASASIEELRRYLRGLSGTAAAPLNPLLEGVQALLEQFSRLYGIEAEVKCAPALALNDRLTAEVLPMVGESLSNIGRHTRSRRATINFYRKGDSFVCQVANHGPTEDAPWKPFTPVSITRRAEQLGGRVLVDRMPDGGSVVTVDIPL